MCKQLKKLILDPISAKFPIWFLNRRKDIETGADLHLFNVRYSIHIKKMTLKEKELPPVGEVIVT